jgi:hypothetical protein
MNVLAPRPGAAVGAKIVVSESNNMRTGPEAYTYSAVGGRQPSPMIVSGNRQPSPQEVLVQQNYEPNMVMSTQIGYRPHPVHSPVYSDTTGRSDVSGGYAQSDSDQWNAQQAANMYTQEQIDEWNNQLRQQGYHEEQISMWNSQQRVYTQAEIDQWYQSQINGSQRGSQY